MSFIRLGPGVRAQAVRLAAGRSFSQEVDDRNAFWMKRSVQMKTMGDDASDEEKAAVVQAHYNEQAPEYEETLVDKWGWDTPHLTVEAWMKHEKRAQTEEKQVVYDLGCGTGLVGSELLRRGARDIALVGADFSVGPMAQIEEKRPGVYAALHQVNMNEFPHPFPDNAFDGAICSGALSYCTHFEELWAELARVTKRDSLIAISHRTDAMAEGGGRAVIDAADSAGVLEWVEHISEVPYLALNPDYSGGGGGASPGGATGAVTVDYIVVRNCKAE